MEFPQVRLKFYISTCVFALCTSMLLIGCGGGSSSRSQPSVNPFDGNWIPTYSKLIITVNQTCLQTYSALTLTNGTGSATYTRTCRDSTTNAIVSQITESISVGINSGGIINAIVGNTSLSGTCISTTACLANSSMSSLSLVR